MLLNISFVIKYHTHGAILFLLFGIVYNYLIRKNNKNTFWNDYKLKFYNYNLKTLFIIGYINLFNSLTSLVVYCCQHWKFKLLLKSCSVVYNSYIYHFGSFNLQNLTKPIQKYFKNCLINYEYASCIKHYLQFTQYRLLLQ